MSFPDQDAITLSPANSALQSTCDVAERERYRRIRITADHESIENAFELLMDILKRPSLGEFVERIEYIKTPRYGIQYTGKEYERDLSEEDMHLLRTAVQKAGFTGTREERLINMLMHKTPKNDMRVTEYHGHKFRNFYISPVFVVQALTVVLISVSPNLVSMGMTQPFSHYKDIEEGENQPVEFPLVRFFLEVNANPQGKPYLQNLRDIYLINDGRYVTDDGRFYIQMDMIACLELFNQLPSIESVAIDALEEDSDNGKPGYERKTSNISRVRINHSSLDITFLLRVMSSCKVLRELQYTIGGRASNDGGFPIFNPKAFIKGISEHKATLEILDVDVEAEIWEFHGNYHRPGGAMEPDFEKYGGPSDYQHCQDGEDREKYQFLTSIWEHSGSLKEFVALKELSLGIGFLLYFVNGVSGGISGSKQKKAMLVDSLPDRLEYLCIRGYQKGKNEEHDLQVEALMAQFNLGSLGLKEIKGVSEMIPNAESVEDPDNDGELLWSLEDAGYPSWNF